MSEVEVRRTVITPAQAEALFRLAWEARYGVPVQDRQLRLLLALWDLETAAGQKQFNFNFGNVIRKAGTAGDFIVLDDSGNTRRFKAYLTADEGADDLLAELDFKPEWRASLVRGDSPEGFAAALKSRGYFEAPLDRYARTLRARWENYPHLSAPMASRPARESRPRKPSNGAGLFFFSQQRASAFTFGVGGTLDHLPRQCRANRPGGEPLDPRPHR